MFEKGEDKESHFREVMIDDMLFLMLSIQKKELRLFYYVYRSLIENLHRVILRYENEDNTGVRKTFENAKIKYPNSDFFDYLNGEYSKCCNSVHSNINSDVDIHKYYDEIENVELMNDVKQKQLIDEITTFYKKCLKFFVINEYEMIYERFNNNNEVLVYLIGPKLYDEFMSKLE